MAICVHFSGVNVESNGQTEATCTAYLLQTADELRHSYFFYGVELVDVIEVSGGVVLAWALAWGIKVLRRAL
ncbi:hypothetical protein V3O24_00780 [Methylobacter sp. Wu8]|uniref:hypothetical protein n=1 Tax=Methylobacter sp. Wu8 TaxID=3118457 RepID=UPI002F334B78